MNPIFGAGPSLSLRFTLVLLLSVSSILYDAHTDSSVQIRNYLNTLVSPIQYLASLPQQGFDGLAKYASTKQSLLDENQKLKELQLLQNESLQKYEMLKAENDKLRALLATNLRSETKKQVAEIMAVASQPLAQTVVINKGSSDEVYQGQPVLDDLGVVGQVTSVGNNNSRVILVTDQTHAVPIRVMRNGVRGILAGTGNIQQMELVNLPHNTEIQVGDRLVTSGLGGVFPEGYPVAEVKVIFRDLSKPFMKVIAEPVAKVDRLKHILLLWHKSPEVEALQ